MRCENCGSDMEQRWRFCPGCGFRIAGRKDIFNAMFGNLFSRMDREMKTMDRLMEKHMEVLDLTPFMRQPASSGFTIRITQAGRDRPQVSVRTFGDVDRERIARQVQRQLGARPQVQRDNRDGSMGMEMQRQLGARPQVPYSAPGHGPASQEMREPKVTEEPKALVSQKDGGVVVEIELPGVAARDLEVSELEDSVEIRALAGDKAFFKILTKPQNARLLAHRFSGGKLTVEFSR